MNRITVTPQLNITVPALDGGTTLSAGSPSTLESCTRIRDLGFSISQHIKMYGQRLELTSDPFSEGEFTAIHALIGSDPTERTIRLPISILTGLADRFRHP